MTETLRYGFIGCGMMGQEHLRNLALVPGSVVTRIFEPDDGMARRSLEIAPRAERVPDLDRVVTADDVDVIVVTSPNFRHAEQLQRIARLRSLPVLLEKPACTDLAQVAALRSMAGSFSAPLWVAMEYRYMPPISQLVKEVHSQACTGPVAMISIREHRYPFLEKVGHWNRFNRYTGGTLVEKCCHFFDLMRLLARSRPVRIYATAGTPHNHQDEWHAEGAPDILDHAYAVVDFESGPRALLELCMFAEGSRYQEEISVVGSAGKVECFVPGPGRFWPAHLGSPPVPRLVKSPRQPAGPMEIHVPVEAAALAAGDHNGSTLEQHRRFRAAVLGEGPVEVTLADGLAAVVMGLAAQESVRTGQAIDLRAGPYALAD